MMRRGCWRYAALACLACLAGLAQAADSGPAVSATEIRAQLSPRYSTTLSAELPAAIVQLDVRDGDRFKKGQVLVAFDCAVQQAQLHKAQATAQGANKTYEVNARLAKLESASTLDVEVAAAKAGEAQADIAVMRATLAKCQITAPFDGRVVELAAHPHQYLKLGDPIMEILDDSQLELKLIVPSQWLQWLKLGQPFTVKLDETAKEYPAEIIMVGARIDPVSQSIPVLGRIQGQHRELLAGMSGKALFPNAAASEPGH